MADVSEAPTVMNAWLIAIPSAITAISILIQRSGSKASTKSTNDKIDETAKAQNELIAALRTTITTQNLLIDSQTKRIKELTEKAEEIRTNQVSIASKHAELVETTAKSVDRLSSIIDPKAPHVEVPEETDGKVKVIEIPPQPLGKTIVKP